MGYIMHGAMLGYLLMCDWLAHTGNGELPCSNYQVWWAR